MPGKEYTGRTMYGGEFHTVGPVNNAKAQVVVKNANCVNVFHVLMLF